MPRPIGHRRLASALFFVVATVGIAALAREHVPFERLLPTPLAVAPPPAITTVSAAPRVVVAPAEMLPPGRALSLLGEVRPFKQAVLYAKVSGYLKQVRFDKGDKVRKGQVLGVLENSDADGRIASAQAEYSQKSREAERRQALMESGSVSREENERADTDLSIAKAELSRAYVNKGYSTMRAPFAGVVTARHADPGVLLQAATSTASGALPLAEISDVSSVRVTVFVGQSDAPFIREGTAVKIWSDARPSERIETKITRTTRALDTYTRTMQCEIVLPNADARFTTGSTVHVDLTAASPSALAVPAEAVFFRQGRPAVMAVRDGKAMLTRVETGDHDGRRIRILSGLAEGDLVALNAGHELADGTPVEAVRRAEPKARVAAK